MKLGLIYFTPNGKALADKLLTLRQKQDLLSDKIEWISRPEKTSASQFTSSLWKETDGFIFIGAAGIAVRLVAPLIVSKAVDPAVVVIDEKGRYVIPILSGHLGGANHLAIMLSEAIGASPVITTATDLNGVFAVDVWSSKTNCALKEVGLIKEVSGALLRGEQVGITSDFPISGALPEGLTLEKTNVGICISLDDSQKPYFTTLHLVPRILILGVGCKKNTDVKKFSSFVKKTLKEAGISILAIKELASIDLKKDEPCIQAFCSENDLLLRTFTAEQLRSAKGDFTASVFVEQTVGVDNVCERSAVAAGGKLFIKKQTNDGMTLAVSLLDFECKF